MVSLLGAAGPAPGDEEAPAEVPVVVDEGEPRNHVAARVSYYFTDDDHGEGNPFLDEELTVIEPVLLYERRVGDEGQLSVQLAHDWVTAASIERLDNYPQQSGASGDYYFGADVSLRGPVAEDVTLGGAVHGSFERDYRSSGLGADCALDVLGGRVSLGVQGFYDSVTRIRHDGFNQGTRERITLSATLSVYGPLARWLHGEVGYTFSYQKGFLEANINGVVLSTTTRPNPLLDDGLPGVEVTEELPGHRARHTLFGRLRGLVEASGTAVELGGRLYGDSWDVRALTLEPRVFQWLARDVLMLRLRYRFYTQEPARDWRRVFTSQPYHRTQDSDLGDYDAHTIGAKLVLTLADGACTFDLAADYTWRTDELDAVAASAGVGLRY